MKKAWLPLALALVVSLAGSRAASPNFGQQSASDSDKMGLAITNLSRGLYDEAIRISNDIIYLRTNAEIGTTMAVVSGYPIVTTVRPLGPAERAGIVVGDKIVKMNRKSTKGWGAIEIRQTLMGLPGTDVLVTLERKGTFNRIEKAVTRENYLPPEFADFLGIRSLAFRYKVSRESALENAEKAYSLNPGSEWARRSLAAVYLDSGRYDESRKLLSALHSAQDRLLEACAVMKQGKTQEAVEIYAALPEESLPLENAMIAADREALLQLLKPLAAERRAKARMFELKNQYSEALAELSEALKFADKSEAELVYDALFGMVRKFPSALELPEEARKHSLRAELEIKDGSFERAAMEYRMAIRIAPYAARLYYNLALTNETLKKYAEAILYMKLYLRAVPDAPDARAAKDAIIKWEFEMEKGR